MAINRSARRWRACPTPDSSQSTTMLAPISISESMPKPANATDCARTAARASTTMPTAFQPKVAASRTRPRRRSAAPLAGAGGELTTPIVSGRVLAEPAPEALLAAAGTGRVSPAAAGRLR